jgi:hypothetical protein
MEEIEVSIYVSSYHSCTKRCFNQSSRPFIQHSNSVHALNYCCKDHCTVEARSVSRIALRKIAFKPQHVLTTAQLAVMQLKHCEPTNSSSFFPFFLIQPALTDVCNVHAVMAAGGGRFSKQAIAFGITPVYINRQ